MRFAAKRENESYRLGVLHGLVYGDGAWNRLEDPVGRASSLRSALRRAGRAVPRLLRSGRFFARRWTSILDTQGQASCARSEFEALSAGGCRHGVRRRFRRRVGRRRRRSGQGRIVAPALDRPRGARSGSSRRRPSPATSSSAPDRRAASRRTSACAAGRFAGCYLATREVSWRVMNVEEEQADAADTFCAVVPETHMFTLSGGVYTRNCGACEPECPVEAIFPEDALPEKWQPFIRSTTPSTRAWPRSTRSSTLRDRAQRPERAAGVANRTRPACEYGFGALWPTTCTPSRRPTHSMR